jgi:hypothetical protein
MREALDHLDDGIGNAICKAYMIAIGICHLGLRLDAERQCEVDK